MKILNNSTYSAIKKAAAALADGKLVVFPTETVYGLGADATNKKAVMKIYKVKARPSSHPLIVHISSISQLQKWAIDIPDYAIKFAKEFWPGPMTLILKRNDIAKDFITGGQDFIGLRVPNNEIALTLIKEFEKLGGFGIAAPSANRFGAVSPTSTSDVIEEIGDLLSKGDIILDGKRSLIGIESTIIDCTKSHPSILRPGAVTSRCLRGSLGKTRKLKRESKITKRTSGSFKSHYSPKAIVRLNTKAQKGDGFIAMSSVITPKGAIRLASPRSLEEYARVLYSAFRNADRKGVKTIVVITPNEKGLGVAINDRVLKASTPNNANKN